MDRVVTEVLVFEVEGQRHGLPVAQVRELLPAMQVTPLPAAPHGIEGVVNLRGTIVPVVAVRKLFGVPPRPLMPSDHFIVACLQDQMIVLHVDRAMELAQLETNAIALESTAAPRVAKSASGLVVLHDVHHFLSAKSAELLLNSPPSVKEMQP
jgi:purine-binding chemotaxis protein CheW